MQNALLNAIQPDTIVLAVNADDSNDCILRSVNFVEAITGVSVACPAVSHRNDQPTFSPSEQKCSAYSEEDMAYRVGKISSLTNKKVLRTDQTEEIFAGIIDELDQEAFNFEKRAV